MAVKWTKGGPTSLIVALEAKREDLNETARAIVIRNSQEGERRMEQIITEAETRTGLRRVDTGGASSAYGSTSPGRIDSGLMINQVGSRNSRQGNEYVGNWGWFDPEPYFLDQENGDGRIEAMHALLGSFIATREAFLADVAGAHKLVGGF